MLLEYTRARLAKHLVQAFSYSSALVGAVAAATWAYLGREAGLAVYVGAAIVGMPQVLLAMSMFSRFGAHATVLLGVAKFGLSALLFGAWFSLVDDSQPGAVFVGAALVLVSGPVFYYLAATNDSKAK